MKDNFFSSFSELSRIIKLKLVISFFNKTAMRAIIPFMVLFFSSTIGNVQTGILLTINLLLQILSTSFGGYLSDLYDKKRIIVTGQLFNTLSFIGMTVFISDLFFNPLGVITFFLLSSIVGNIHKAPLDAIILDDVTKKNKRFVYTVEYWTSNVSLSLGIFIGSIFYKENIFELFVVLCITLVVTTLFYQYVILKKSDQLDLYSNPPNKKNILKEYIYVLQDKNWNFYVIGGALIFFAELTLSNYTAIKLKNDFTPVTIFDYRVDGVSIYSYLIIINTVIATFFSFTVEKYSRFMQDKVCLILGVIINCSAYGMMAFFEQWSILFILIIFATIGELLYAPIRQSFQYELIPENNKSMYLSTGYLAIQIGNILASLSISIGEFIGDIGMPILIIVLGITGLKLTLLSLKKG